jgi:Tfp pilus assembly protein PilF
MKTWWTLVSAAALLVAFTGCSRQVTRNSTTTNPTPATATKVETPSVVQQAVNPGMQRASAEFLETGKRKWRVGQMKQAQKSFAKAVEKNPYNFEAHYWLAMMERDARNWDRASHHFAQAIQYCPQGRWESRIRVEWGLTFEQQGQKGMAAKQYDLALLADPNYKEAQVSRQRVIPLPSASFDN